VTALIQSTTDEPVLGRLSQMMKATIENRFLDDSFKATILMNRFLGDSLKARTVEDSLTPQLLQGSGTLGLVRDLHHHRLDKGEVLAHLSRSASLNPLALR